MKPRKLNCSNGIVCRLPGERFGYFGWPTVARRDDGTLLVASSGLRAEHVCPFGKTVLNVSTDDGRTWSAPVVIQDSPIDDRDAGIVNLGGDKLLVSWFRSDTRKYRNEGWIPEDERARWDKVFAEWTDDRVNALCGSWVMLSEDAGATWGLPIRAPVSTPHGPIRLRNGDLLYLGKPYGTWTDMGNAIITAARSQDGGRTWRTLGRVPLYPKTVGDNYHEPHVVELPSGKLIGAIRMENGGGVDLERDAGIRGGMSIMMTDSDDGGLTWSDPRPLNFHGGPPHLLRHSSGVLVLTYGYRLAPFGQRVAFSRDDGATWDHDWIIRDDGPDGDLGYPSTVELADGSLFTVCYQKAAAGEKCSLLWSKWRLPKS
jgi:sialidase-1